MERCEHCGAFIRPTVKRKRDYEREVGKLLELTPKGYNINKQPYFEMTNITGLKEMIAAIKKLKGMVEK